MIEIWLNYDEKLIKTCLNMIDEMINKEWINK